MSTRKQSLTSDEIVSREKDVRLPSAGVPGIQNFQYSGVSRTQLPNDVNDNTETTETLAAPGNLEVVAQTIRFAPDGTQYVTVVVEFDEVTNATGYEARVAKV